MVLVGLLYSAREMIRGLIEFFKMEALMSICRHPRTVGERRAAHAAITDTELAELGIKIRPRRGIARESLPSDHDDRVRSMNGTANWKRYRATRWRR